MVKKIALFILASFMAIIGYSAYLWVTQPVLIAPLPYHVDVDYKNESDIAEAAHVLILGDRLGDSLKSYIPKMITNLSENLQEPLRIVNWSSPHESLGRSLAKLKSLKVLPKMIIYLGASEEFYEKRFEIKDSEKILENVKKFRQENISTLLYTFPPISKLIYAPVEFLTLGSTIKEDPGDLDSRLQQQKMEVTFNLFEVELDEFIAYTKEKGSHLVLVTAPLNLEVNPRKACANSTTESLETYQRSLKKSLDSGAHKAVLNEVRKLSETSIGNAVTYHLLGRSSLGSGFYEEARRAFINAAAYDCGNWRAHPVFNSLIKSKSKISGNAVIDFDEIVNRHLGLNELFLSDHFPQNIYYDHFIEELELAIKVKFKL
ncbi:MAG: hypothetical protein ACJAT2_002794 [Bacteriovoracaceae bacterium]|jgi:hypothetical protein